MRVGSMIIRVRPGAVSAVVSRLERIEGVEVIDQRYDGVALLIEASTASAQRALHARIASLPDVGQASLVFQSSEI